MLLVVWKVYCRVSIIIIWTNIKFIQFGTRYSSLKCTNEQCSVLSAIKDSEHNNWRLISLMKYIDFKCACYDTLSKDNKYTVK